MKKEQFKFDYPSKELTISYEDDPKDYQESMKEKKIIIEIPTKRPSWFSKDLATKVITDKQNKD